MRVGDAIVSIDGSGSGGYAELIQILPALDRPVVVGLQRGSGGGGGGGGAPGGGGKDGWPFQRVQEAARRKMDEMKGPPPVRRRSRCLSTHCLKRINSLLPFELEVRSGSGQLCGKSWRRLLEQERLCGVWEAWKCAFLRVPAPGGRELLRCCLRKNISPKPPPAYEVSHRTSMWRPAARTSGRCRTKTLKDGPAAASTAGSGWGQFSGASYMYTPPPPPNIYHPIVCLALLCYGPPRPPPPRRQPPPMTEEAKSERRQAALRAAESRTKGWDKRLNKGRQATQARSATSEVSLSLELELLRPCTEALVCPGNIKHQQNRCGPSLL